MTNRTKIEGYIFSQERSLYKRAWVLRMQRTSDRAFAETEVDNLVMDSTHDIERLSAHIQMTLMRQLLNGADDSFGVPVSRRDRIHEMLQSARVTP